MTSPSSPAQPQPKSTPTQLQAFKTKAYSDDGCRRKQSSGKLKLIMKTRHASRAPIV
jgi:hypothetical protein